MAWERIANLGEKDIGKVTKDHFNNESLSEVEIIAAKSPKDHD